MVLLQAPQEREKSTYTACSTLPEDFNWNIDFQDLSPLPLHLPVEPTPQQIVQTKLFSECLRDGLHGIPAYPSLEQCLEYIAALKAFGVSNAMVGIYSGEHNVIDANIKQLLTSLRDQYPAFIPQVLCPCTMAAFDWVSKCKDIHPGLEIGLFMGSAPSRRLVQGWDLDFICKNLAYYVEKAVKRGIPVIGATEHTTQTPPEDLARIVRAQVENGAYRFIIADTIGIARPRGAYRIVHFVRHVLKEISAEHVEIDWHGHRDTGNAVANALMAIAAGARHIHVVARGVGERAGNTSLEDLVLNFHMILEEAKLASPWQLSHLSHLLALYEDLVGMETPEYGVLARRYNHTSLGIHTDAIFKANRSADEAQRRGDTVAEQNLRKLMRTIYSAVDPQSVGGQCSVGVSQWSGRSSVYLAYRYRGGDPNDLTEDTIEKILSQAKNLSRELTDDELDQSFSAVLPSSQGIV